MANLFDILGLASQAKVQTDTAALEGQGIAQQKQQADLLLRLKQEQEAQDRALRQRQSEASIAASNAAARASDALTDQRLAPPVPEPRYDPNLRGWTQPDGSFTPVQAPPSATPAYEERSEGGGVAIYTDGRFDKWKVRPQSERDASIGEQMGAQRLFQRESGLKDDFRNEQEIKDAKGIAGAVTTIRGSLAQNTPQGDLAAIYALVKLYDPGSVVREGEIKLTQSASSLPQRVRLLWTGWNSGRKLLPEQRNAVAAVANSIVTERQAQINPVLARYGRDAARWGVDSASVAPNPLSGAEVPLADAVLQRYGLEPARKP